MNEHNEATILIELREEDDDGLRCKVSLDGAFSPHMAGVAVAQVQGALQTAMELPEALMDVLIKAAKMEMQQRKQKPSSPRDKLYELLEALHEQKENANDERQA